MGGQEATAAGEEPEGLDLTRDPLTSEGGGRLRDSTGNVDSLFAGILCRRELNWQASTEVA